MTDTSPVPLWRVGRSVGRTIYRMVGDEASKQDVLIGVMDTPELAAQVVEAVNAQRARLKHTGGNAEDCPICKWRRDLPYPFICPGNAPESPQDGRTGPTPHTDAPHGATEAQEAAE